MFQDIYLSFVIILIILILFTLKKILNKLFHIDENSIYIVFYFYVLSIQLLKDHKNL